jgi:hypothetical protein
VKDFWSVILYDNQTHSMLQTDQQSPSLSSQTKGLLVNSDGSVDIYFGPKAPVGKEQNWIQTAWQGVEPSSARLRSARTVVQQDVAAG